MSNQQIDYASLVESALLRVVHDVLASVAEDGLPGRHHFYITFRTDRAGVVVDDTLRERYPNEMTIVLQHEYWDLDVDDAGFKITLKFNNTAQRLEIPFEAVTVFADPSVEFGLQFSRAGALEADAPTPAPVAKLPAAIDKSTGPSPEQAAKGRGGSAEVAAEGADPADAAGPADQGDADDDGEDKVVTLDRFRKK